MVFSETGRSSGLAQSSTPSHSFIETVVKIEELQHHLEVRSFYSYGDSAGFTPASLLIPTDIYRNQEPITSANVAAIFLEFKNKF